MMYEHITWLIPQRVLYATSPQHLQITGFNQTLAELLSVLRRKPSKPIHIIIEVTPNRRNPKPTTPLGDAIPPYFQHPALGWTVLISAPIVDYFVQIVTRQIDNPALWTAADLPSAIKFLQHQDQTLLGTRDWQLPEGNA